jgi:hypothetical protein
LLPEVAAETGLVGGVTAALIDTYPGVSGPAPGRVFTDLAGVTEMVGRRGGENGL